MANNIKSTSNTKNAILAFVKNLIPKSLYKDMVLLLEPCCNPVLSVSDNYACNGSDTEFEITLTGLKPSTPITVILTMALDTTTNIYSAAVNDTSDANGEFSDTITIPFYVSDGTAYLTASVILDGSQVVTKSNTFTATGISNCD